MPCMIYWYLGWLSMESPGTEGAGDTVVNATQQLLKKLPVAPA